MGEAAGEARGGGGGHETLLSGPPVLLSGNSCGPHGSSRGAVGAVGRSDGPGLPSRPPARARGRCEGQVCLRAHLRVCARALGCRV